MAMKTIFLLYALLTYSIATSAQMQFVAPKPGSQYHNPERNIILRPGGTLDMQTLKSSLFKITGSQSGNHDFDYHIALDGRTIILQPRKPFANDEEVTCSLTHGLKLSDRSSVEPYTFSFFIKRKYTAEEEQRIENFRQNVIQDEYGTLSEKPENPSSENKNASSPYYQ